MIDSSRPHKARYPVTWVALTLVGVVGSVSTSAQNPPFQSGFPAAFDAGDGRAWESSPAVGQLDGSGGPEIVVGTLAGKIMAYHGDGSFYWEYDTLSSTGISGKPAIGDVDGDGLPEVVFSVGSTVAPGDGGIWVLSHDGQYQCEFSAADMASTPGAPNAVYGSPGLGDLDENDGGALEIVFGAWDFYIRALQGDCSLFWEVFAHDTVWSSPALGDLDKDGHLDVVIGADTNRSSAAPLPDHQGGSVHLFDRFGVEQPGFPVDVDEVVWSSPALGDLTGDGYLDIVVGIGRCWDLAGCSPLHHEVSEQIYAWNRFGGMLPGWPVPTPNEYAFASPALGDLDDDGLLEVVVNTIYKGGGAGGAGRVYALNGNGSAVPGWPKQPQIRLDCFLGTRTVETGASPVIADIDGDGELEVLLVSNWEIVVWSEDGTQESLDQGVCPNGSHLVMETESSLAASPAVADLDLDGDLEVIIGGAASNGTDGKLYAWDLGGSRGSERPWPEGRQGEFNHARLDPDSIFEDGFESGNLSSWN